MLVAWLPYMLLVVFVLTWGEVAVKAAIDAWTNDLARRVGCQCRRQRTCRIACSCPGCTI